MTYDTWKTRDDTFVNPAQTEPEQPTSLLPERWLKSGLWAIIYVDTEIQTIWNGSDDGMLFGVSDSKEDVFRSLKNTYEAGDTAYVIHIPPRGPRKDVSHEFAVAWMNEVRAGMSRDEWDEAYQNMGFLMQHLTGEDTK